MSFSKEDIVNNFTQFILSVKRATGNARDPDASDRKLMSAGGARPGTLAEKLVMGNLLTIFYSDPNIQSHAQLISRTWNPDI